MSIQCPACLTDNPAGTEVCIACGYSPLTSMAASASTPSMYHLSQGTLLKQGHYQIEKVIGEGGFGITYKGIKVQTSTPVAIKELWPEKSARQGTSITWPSSIPPKERQQQLKKFQLEAKYLSQCQHPNIVKVYEWFEENNTAYLVMELISGQSLHQIRKENGVLTESKAKHYFIQVAEALKVIHSHNFLHRDIKPDNILIDQHDRAILIDFGATREFIAGQTSEVSVTLTAGYAPVEQYSYRGKRFPCTDFYALCASMYELLTGQLPAESTDRARILLQKGPDPLVSPRKLRPTISLQMDQVILAGMQVNVQDRFQTADELINALKDKFVSPNQKKAQDLAKQNKLSSAVRAYERCLKSEPNNGDAAVELALVNMHLNDAKAEIAAQKATTISPKDGRGYGVLGLVCCRKGHWSAASNHLQHAVNLAPNEAWIQANFAWALGKQGSWQHAEVAASKAIQLDGDCVFAHGIKAWIMSNREDWKATIRAAKPAIFKSKQIISQRSQNLQQWVHPHLIIALEKATVNKQSRDADRCIEEFITQAPDNALAWGLRAWKNASQGKWGDAVSDFRNASQRSNTPGWLLGNLGVAYEQRQEISKAIQTYKSYEQRFPSDAFAKFRLGTLLAQQKQWAQACSMLERAIELKPDYAEAHHNLAWVLRNIKDQDGQVANFRKMWTSYQNAIELYTRQNKLGLAQTIQTAFSTISAEI